MLQVKNQAQPLLSPCVVFVTCPTLDEAEKLAHGIVTEALAACVNLIPGAVDLSVGGSDLSGRGSAVGD